MSTKISDLINPTVRDVVPWTDNTLFIVDRIVLVGNSLLKCISTHTSSPNVIADIQSGKWFPLTPFPLNKVEREGITNPVNSMQILQTDDIPYVYTYLNGNWMLQNYTASFLRVVSSAKQVPTVNTSVKFGVTECMLGSSVSYNNSTGIFTLLGGGGIYEFKGGLGACYSGSTGGWISSTWQMSTDGTNWTNVGMARLDLVNSNAWAHVPNINDAGGTLSFEQTTYLRYIPNAISSVSQIGDNSMLTQVGTNQYSWAEITEKSRSNNFKVTLSSDYITDWASYNPILTATTTNPVLGAGAVVNARYSVIGKTLKLNVNIYNPNAGTLGSGNYRVSIPSGFVIDSSKVRTSTNGYDGNGLGSCQISIGSNYGSNGKVVAVSSDQLGLYCAQTWNTNSPLAFWSNSFHGTGANTCVSFSCEIPIL